MTDQSDHAPSLPMRCSSSIAALVVALAKAQGAFPPIEKGKTARIVTKAGGTFSYTYADLSAILAAIRKPLAESELAIMQPVAVTSNRVTVTTLLCHGSGEWVSAELTLPVVDPTDARSLASSITYSRRYGLISLLNISPQDEDDDAAAAVAPKASGTKKDAPKPAPTSSTMTDNESAARSTDGEAFITEAQRRRLFAISKERGWSDADLKTWLIAEGVGSTTKIRAREYDTVITMLCVAERPTSAGAADTPTDAV